MIKRIRDLKHPRQLYYLFGNAELLVSNDCEYVLVNFLKGIDFDALKREILETFHDYVKGVYRCEELPYHITNYLTFHSYMDPGETRLFYIPETKEFAIERDCIDLIVISRDEFIDEFSEFLPREEVLSILKDFL